MPKNASKVLFPKVLPAAQKHWSEWGLYSDLGELRKYFCSFLKNFELPFCILSLLCTNITDILLISLVLYSRQVCFSREWHKFDKECVIFRSVEIKIITGFYIM